jgi:hypothetical protein
VLQAVFRKQQGGRHFQRQLFAAACGYGFARHIGQLAQQAPSADRFSLSHSPPRHAAQRQSGIQRGIDFGAASGPSTPWPARCRFGAFQRFGVDRP